MSAWNVNETQRNVYLSKDGEETTFNFSGTMKLKDVVQSVARQAGLGNVLVQSDGRTVEPDEGDKTLAEFGRISIIPKQVGASDDVESIEEIDEDEDFLEGLDSYEEQETKIDEISC